MSFDDALPVFFAESSELLQEMEDGLLRLENEADPNSTINAIFRAAHTVKGSSGLFGFDSIVEFTHSMESLLDKARGGELQLDSALVQLLLTCTDHIRVLIDAVANARELDQETRTKGARLVAQVRAHLDEPKAEVLPGAASATPAAAAKVVADHGAAVVESEHWHISLRFGSEVLRNGMDPLSFIRYLGTLGEIVKIVTLYDRLPAITELDPETCYLGFEISFRSVASKAQIEGVFEFVRDDCQIHILPPKSRITEYQLLIRAFPSEEQRLGEILISCGTLTPHELETALAEQAQAAPEAIKPLGEILIENQTVASPVVKAALEKQQQVKETKAKEAQTIRVDAEKLDHLINLVGELVIAGAGVNLLARRAQNGEIVEATQAVNQLVEEIRDSSLKLRMVQIGVTFNRFQRVVRDVARELGKEIDLVITGGETELDKSVVEKIGDPLTHLVRNSMDHGIERADLREQRGKPSRGTVSLNAYHDSGSIVIEVSDDGGGMNRQRIVDKAIERGIVAAGQNLSDQEILQLIFEPGFSTAATISNISGRGVGMDVVKRNITSLRGTIELASVEGQGSTVRIRLPLTLAIIDGFLVEVGGSPFVVPLDMVVECIELPPGLADGTDDEGFVNLRGKVLPLVWVRQLLNVQGRAVRRQNVVVVRSAGQEVGLVVDALLGESQTVIKPLGSLFRHLQGISGATILGSGDVALIFDVAGVIQRVTHTDVRAAGRQALQVA